MDCVAYVAEYVSPQWFLGVLDTWEIDCLDRAKVVHLPPHHLYPVGDLLHSTNGYVPLVCHTACSLIPVFAFAHCF